MLHRKTNALEHRTFRELPQYLHPGDALVLNRTKVLPARLLGTRQGGGAAEVLLLKRLDATRWEALVRPGRRMPVGSTVSFGEGALTCRMQETTPGGGRIVAFRFEGAFEEHLDRLGRMPLPPYITTQLDDPSRYQTVYAREEGSAAAPTAGLHFTPELLERIEGMGVSVVSVLLHVGLGTFRPVQEEEIENHVMHEEWFQLSPQAAALLNETRGRGGRIVCVGTTSVRTLESCAGSDGALSARTGDTALFISPGYRFRAVDALVTNFHLPKSSLLMLVSAFCGRETALAAYEEAVRERYRFFSFGDAMLIV